MGRARIAPWIGAIICGAFVCTSAQAGGIFSAFSHRNAACDQPEEPVCQHCQQCKQCKQCQERPPKKPLKKKFCCLFPPEPPQAAVGTSFAADPQAQFADNNPQDDRLNKLDKDLSRLSAIVEQMLQNQGNPQANPQGATPQTGPPRGPVGNTTSLQQGINDPVPPGPIPAAAANSYRYSKIQQVSLPASNTATGR
jgi:hypothetical protein